MEFFLHNGDQHINRQCNPDLGQDRMFGGTVEGFDSQMLLEPAEEEFYLPAAVIQFGYGDCRYGEIVGKKGKSLSRLRIDELDQAQFVRIVPMCVEIDKDDGLIATKSGFAIHGSGVEPPKAGIALCSGDKKSGLTGDAVQTFEVEIAPVENVERAGLDGKQVQSIHVVNLSRRYVHPAGDVPPQIEQRMGLDCSSVLSESCPREERQTETDGCGVERISRLRQIYSEAFGEVKFSGLADQCLGKVRPDSPVAVLVGMGQRTAGNRSAHTHMIEFGLMCPQTAFDISQSFPVGELGEGHAEVLIHAGKGLDVSLASVSFYATGKLLVRNELHYLSEDCSTAVHRLPPFWREYSLFQNLNRSRSKYCNYLTTS